MGVTGATPEAGLDEQQQSHMQTCLLLMQAVAQREEAAIRKTLIDRCTLHPVSEFAFYGGGREEVAYLIATTEGNLELAGSCKSGAKVTPTVYLAIGHVPGIGQLELCLTGTTAPSSGWNPPAGAEMQFWVSKLADQLPMQSLFGFLGRGYSVVLCGYGLAGAVAHAVTTGMLLQLRAEIKAASAAGIDLSVLSYTEGKISSYAFVAPLLFNADAVKWIQQQSMIANLHTIWRSYDGSPHFYTLCSEVAAAAADSSPPEAPPLASLGGKVAGSTSSTGGMSKSNSMLQSAERRRGGQAFACCPPDVLHSSVLQSSKATLTGGDSSPKARSGSSSPAVATAAAAGGAKQSLRRAVTMTAAGQDSGAKSTQAGRQSYSGTTPTSSSGPAAPGISKLAPQTRTGDNDSQPSSWQSALKPVLALSHVTCYQALGCFWLLKKKPGGGCTLTGMTLMDVAKSRNNWLSESNSDLVGRWEWGLEELERELMDAFPWVTYEEGIKVDGHILSRHATIKPQKKLLLRD